VAQLVEHPTLDFGSGHEIEPQVRLPLSRESAFSLSLFLGQSLWLCHFTCSVTLPATFLCGGYNSLQTLVSGWLLTIYMEISAGDAKEKRILLLE